MEKTYLRKRKGLYALSAAEQIAADPRAEVVEVVDGSLIDSVLYCIGGYLYLFIGTYRNCWSSVYTLYTGTDLDKALKILDYQRAIA